MLNLLTKLELLSIDSKCIWGGVGTPPGQRVRSYLSETVLRDTSGAPATA